MTAGRRPKNKPYTMLSPAPPWVAHTLDVFAAHPAGYTAREYHRRTEGTAEAINLSQWRDRVLSLFWRGYLRRVGTYTGHPGSEGRYIRTELAAPLPEETAAQSGRQSMTKAVRPAPPPPPVQLPTEIPDWTVTESQQWSEARADKVCRQARKPIRRNDLVTAARLDTYCAHTVIDICTRIGRLRVDARGNYTATGDDVLPSIEQIAGYP